MERMFYWGKEEEEVLAPFLPPQSAVCMGWGYESWFAVVVANERESKMSNEEGLPYSARV